MERLVLVHGSVTGGALTWRAQRPLAEQFELVVLERPGFPPNPPVERVDFEVDAVFVAELLRPGDHLVGHSYGGVVALLAAALAPEQVASLTVIEPPATRVALDDPSVAVFAAGADELWANGPEEPEGFLLAFLSAVGSDFRPPSPLPPELERAARILMNERPPTEAIIPLDALAAAPFRKLVVSGAHHPAFDGICDVLERELRAKRLVLAGYGHTVQRHPDFNANVTDFVEHAAPPRLSEKGP